MDTMNVALPESMKEFVHSQLASGGYSSASEYIRALIRADQKQQAQEALEAEILQGLRSGQSTAMTAEDWQRIRQDLRTRYAKRQQG